MMCKLLHVSLFLLPFAFGGCYFTITPAICDQIRSDPTKTLPQECRAYDEKAADKASQEPTDRNNSDVIKFTAPAGK